MRSRWNRPHLILPGRTLKEHWEDQKKRSLKKIQSQKWDIVVLQDLSSQPLDAPEDLAPRPRTHACPLT